MQPVNVNNRQNPTGAGVVAGKDEIRFTVNDVTIEYLRWLAANTALGKTENEVARQILIQRLSEMREEKYAPPA